VVSLIVIKIFTTLGGGADNLPFVIYTYSIVGVINGILIWIFLEDSNKASTDDSGSNAGLADMITVIKMPVVWMIGFVVFCNYICFSTLTYATPYMTKIFAASVGLSGALAIFRTWGVGVISSPLAGFIADKTGSVSRVLMYCFLILALCMGGYAMIPENPALLFLVVAAMMIAALAVFAMRGIYWAAVDEAGIPKHLTGAAVGLCSLIGFAPETFIYSLAGHWLDKYPGIKGYQVIFGFTAAMMLVGFICTLVLLRLVRKNRDADRANPAADNL